MRRTDALGTRDGFTFAHFDCSMSQYLSIVKKNRIQTLESLVPPAGRASGAANFPALDTLDGKNVTAPVVAGLGFPLVCKRQRHTVKPHLFVQPFGLDFFLHLFCDHRSSFSVSHRPNSAQIHPRPR